MIESYLKVGKKEKHALFDLFKKTSKPDPDRDDPSGSPALQKKRADAAMELVKAFQEKLPLVGGKPHGGAAGGDQPVPGHQQKGR